MNSWEPTPEQWAGWAAKGYFVIRNAIDGVYSTPQITRRRKLPKHFYWVIRNGALCTAFPPQQVDISEISGPDLFPAAEEAPAPVG